MEFSEAWIVCLDLGVVFTNYEHIIIERKDQKYILTHIRISLHGKVIRKRQYKNVVYAGDLKYVSSDICLKLALDDIQYDDERPTYKIKFYEGGGTFTGNATLKYFGDTELNLTNTHEMSFDLASDE